MAPEDKPEDAQVETIVAAQDAPLPAPPIDPNPPAKKAVIVAAGMNIPSAALTIVVEARKYSGDGTEESPITVDVKKTGYPAGADYYLRYDEDVNFPKDAKVITMGVDVQQLNFSGFTRLPGQLNVGPAHPAYAAANLAYQLGATTIEIVGLTDAEKEKLQPYIDGLPTHAVEPAQVAVSLL